MDSLIGFPNTYRPDSDLSGGQRYPKILTFTVILESLEQGYNCKVVLPGNNERPDDTIVRPHLHGMLITCTLVTLFYRVPLKRHVDMCFYPNTVGETCTCMYFVISQQSIYYLERIDERQIVKCDVIIIILDVTEGLLMILHEGVDLTILALRTRTTN